MSIAISGCALYNEWFQAEVIVFAVPARMSEGRSDRNVMCVVVCHTISV